MKELNAGRMKLIGQIIAECGDYEVRKYIDEVTKSISDVWSVADVIDYCENHAEIECTEDQALDVLVKMKDNHDCNYGLTWGLMVNAVEAVIGE